jgi:hypothetical protein
MHRKASSCIRPEPALRKNWCAAKCSENMSAAVAQLDLRGLSMDNATAYARLGLCAMHILTARIASRQ